ncbi:MAG TPA: penicillin-binding transpeptidase domain-containing protein, partial [Anaerolineales bacterium]|nr:penicillin-binding transpeptidase domain-containing protein [Anaerolineales bacterium]
EVVSLQESIAPYKPVVVAPDVRREVAMTLSEELRNLPGVDIKVAPTRDYPTGALTAHVVGYMGPITREVEDFYIEKGFDPSRDKIGYAGIEAFMQDTLAGKNGSKVVEHDVAGLELRTVGEVTPAVAGSSLVLTVDVRLQAIAEGALRQRLKLENQIRRGQPVTNGVIIAMNPQTGEILALVSLPTYDNQQFARFIPVDYYNELHEHPHRPLLNQAISGEHPPGSVFKLVVASGALQEGIITPEQRVFDPGEIEIVNRYFPNDPGKTRKVVCWKRDGHGNVDFITGVAQSCDVYFYALGGGYEEGGVENGGLGIDLIHQYATWLGYNQPTGIELPGELGGLIPNRDWKRLNIGENWSTGDTYIASIGQGYVLATPIQVLNSFTPFINGGALARPTIIREVLDGEGNVVQPFEPRVIHQTPLKRPVVDLVAKGLRQVMIDGTGKRLVQVEGV